jgi:hypothetical protein
VELSPVTLIFREGIDSGERAGHMSLLEIASGRSAAPIVSGGGLTAPSRTIPLPRRNQRRVSLGRSISTPRLMMPGPATLARS